MSELPLKNVIVLEFCQYLSGPSAGLRLADLGARVIKIESPKGDACRKLAIENLWVRDTDSLLFHTINRNKESLTADLKDPNDLEKIRKLITKSDVMLHNFRPGVMEKLGLAYEDIRKINDQMIYGEITGYGEKGPWSKLPGQDLLIQARSGLMYTSGNQDDPPVPFGLAIADMICGAQMVQGILAALIRREKHAKGALLQLSLMESLLDFQFELLTTYYASGKLPVRSKKSNGHTLLGAPYGIHQTRDGYIAVAMVNIQALGKVLECEGLKQFDQKDAFSKRDQIKSVLGVHLKSHQTSFWMKRLQQSDLWAMEVFDWEELSESAGFKYVRITQKIGTEDPIETTRCPININGKKLYNEKPAPELGANTQAIIKEFDLEI